MGLSTKNFVVILIAINWFQEIWQRLQDAFGLYLC